MAVARLVSLFESKSLLPHSSSAQNQDQNQHIDSFASRSLRSSPIMSSDDEPFTRTICIQPYHFNSKCASRQRYYDNNSASPTASPSSSYRGSERHSFRSHSPMSSGTHTPTRTRFQQLRLRRIPSHVDLALAAERDEQGLELLEPRPVRVVTTTTLETAWWGGGRPASLEVLLDGILEVLEGR